jgi:sugar phosphate permease
VKVTEVLRLPNVWLLALAIFATNTGGYSLTFWLPTTVKSLSGGSDRSTLLYSGLFYLCGVAGVLYAGYSSDRSGDRKWHCIAGQVLTHPASVGILDRHDQLRLPRTKLRHASNPKTERTGQK